MAGLFTPFTNFWSNPIEGLKAIFTPSAGVDGTLPDSFISLGSQGLAADRIQAYGIDPSTGKPFVSNLSNAVQNGYSGNSQDFIDSVTAMVQNQYNAEYQSSYDSQSWFGSGGSGSGVLGSALLPLLIALVVAYVFIKAVK